MTGIAFREAVEAHDLDALRRSLAPEVVFRSPIRFRPFVVPDEVAAILRIPAEVLAIDDAFRYTSMLGDDRELARFFEGAIDGRSIQGVDHLRLNDESLVTELRVMLQPLAQPQRLADKATELLSRTT
jgi:hypothetical protein